MKSEERLSKLPEEEYPKIFGVTKRTFEEMLKVLEADCGQKHKKGGNPPKLSVLDKLIIMLQYYREYRAMWHIAFDYGVVKSTSSDAVAWAERTVPSAVKKETAGNRIPYRSGYSRRTDAGRHLHFNSNREKA